MTDKKEKFTPEKMAEKRLERLEDLREDKERIAENIATAKRQLELHEEIYGIMMDEFEIVSPTWSYQEDEEYVELVKELKEMNQESQLEKMRDNLDRLENQQQMILDNLEGLKKEMNDDGQTIE